MESTNNTDEVQNREIDEEVVSQPETQAEGGVQVHDVVHALGEELARMFETGSGTSARSTSTAMTMPLTSATSITGGTIHSYRLESSTRINLETFTYVGFKN